jgi:hypothetical protein
MIFRVVVIALLAMVIPIQGMAAISAGQCMAFGHHGDSTQGGPDHAHDHADDDAHSADSHAGHDSADGSGKAQHCGPCVACCASASITSRVDLPLLTARSEAQYFFAQFPPLGIQPDGLDRPPSRAL